MDILWFSIGFITYMVVWLIEVAGGYMSIYFSAIGFKFTEALTMESYVINKAPKYGQLICLFYAHLWNLVAYLRAGMHYKSSFKQRPAPLQISWVTLNHVYSDEELHANNYFWG